MFASPLGGCPLSPKPDTNQRLKLYYIWEWKTKQLRSDEYTGINFNYQKILMLFFNIKYIQVFQMLSMKISKLEKLAELVGEHRPGFFSKKKYRSLDIGKNMKK